MAADDITEADADAVADAVDELLADPEVDAVRLSGDALTQGTPRDGLNRAIRALGTLAKHHGKEFIVGPI